MRKEEFREREAVSKSRTEHQALALALSTEASIRLSCYIPARQKHVGGRGLVGLAGTSAGALSRSLASKVWLTALHAAVVGAYVHG